MLNTPPTAGAIGRRAAAHDVVHEGEVARLSAVAEDLHGLAAKRGPSRRS